jgi:FHS family L-fucose permease-like MFS transporter
MVRYATDKQIWGISPSQAAQYVTYYFLAMLFGRFSGIFVMRKLTDKTALSIYAVSGIILTLAGIFGKGSLAIIALVLTGICQSVMWGNIFGLSTKGLGHLTNKATSLMLTAIAGGGIVTLVMGFIADFWGVKAAFGLMVPLYIYMIWFAQSAEKLESKNN